MKTERKLYINKKENRVGKTRGRKGVKEQEKTKDSRIIGL